MSFTLSSKAFPALATVHSGTGTATGFLHVADPDTVDKDVGTPMEFKFLPYSTQILSLETDAPDPPNWFGVSFRSGITSFDTATIFCHPHPGNAGMNDGDYPSRGGGWPRLFRYAEMFGKQMSIAKTNHITIVPFFTSSTYGSLGIFAEHWLDLVEQIIVHVRNAAQSAAAPASPATPGGRTPGKPANEVNRLETSDATRKKGAKGAPPRTSSNTLKSVVLSDFSRGRALANTVRSSAQGMTSFLREVWDFDGVGGAVPSAPRVLTYDQHKTKVRSKDHFHVPPERWVKYHNAVVANVHGDIPAMLACHAATISGVGH